MGGHDMAVEQDKDGNYVYRSVCVPFGTVPVQDGVHYEDIREPDGEIKTYVAADCILWAGRFPELLDAAYSEDWLFSQSMEINVKDCAPLEEDKNYADILHYTYSALCLLGRSDNEEYNTEPCFPGSHVAVSYENTADESFISLMEEFKKALSGCFSGKTDEKEGEMNMDNKNHDAAHALMPETGSGTAAEEARVFTFREKAEALAEAMPNSQNMYYYVCGFDDKYAFVERCSHSDDGDYAEELGRLEYTYDEAGKKASVVGGFEPMVVR